MAGPPVNPERPRLSIVRALLIAIAAASAAALLTSCATAKSRAAVASRAIIGSDEDMAARPESLRSSRRDNIPRILYRWFHRYTVLSMLLTITIGVREATMWTRTGLYAAE